MRRRSLKKDLQAQKDRSRKASETSTDDWVVLVDDTEARSL